MKKVLFSLAAIATFALVANSALAQCSFDEPAKAKGLKSDLIRSYSACPGVTFLSPNTITMAGVPGCNDASGNPVPRSPFKFNDKKGKCSVKTQAKVFSDCPVPGDPPTSTGVPCMNLTLSAKCSGITEGDGSTPISGGAWSLNTVARATFNDSAGGDMTVIDFPAQFAFATPAKGKMKLKQDTNGLLNFLFGPGSELPGCTAIEVLSLAVADPDGGIFAVMGSSGR